MRDEPLVECALISGWQAYCAQGTMVVIVITALVLKRYIEQPRRSLLVWGMDVSKQAFSASCCHMSNIIFAVAASRGTTSASQCSWYFTQFNVDNIVGVFMTLTMHRTFVWITRKVSSSEEDSSLSPLKWRVIDAISKCGEYGDPPSFARWAIQVVEWIASVIIGRTISGVTTVFLRKILWYRVAEGVDRIFVGRPAQLVFFVLVLYPLFLGLIVAWIQDGVLKLRNRYLEGRESSSRAPLLPRGAQDNECGEMNEEDGSVGECNQRNEFDLDSAEGSFIICSHRLADLDSAYSCVLDRGK